MPRTLYIANKNYSSWSLRPWLLMRALGVPFEEVLLRFDDEPAWAAFRVRFAAGKVPALIDDGRPVWESIAIVEHLAETVPGVWPAAPDARAWARSAAAEMHAGFATLRQRCGMNVGIRVRLHEVPPALQKDVDRIDALWTEGLSRFGGPYLAGERFTAVDAMFAPVVFRVQTYGLALSAAPAAWVARMLAEPGMREWYAAGLAEPFRDLGHDAECREFGLWAADLRVGAEQGVR